MWTKEDRIMVGKKNCVTLINEWDKQLKIDIRIASTALSRRRSPQRALPKWGRIEQ